MGHRFKNTDRNTPLRLPPDLRDWVAEDDLVHFIVQAVDRLPWSTFAVNRPQPCLAYNLKRLHRLGAGQTRATAG